MLHYFHGARGRSADAIECKTWQCAENDGKRGSHFRLQAQAIAEKANREDCRCGNNGRLQHGQHHRDSKQRARSDMIAGCIRTRDKCRDRIVQTQDANLANDVGDRPHNGKNTESDRAKQTRDEKSKNRPEI